jgi:hypothetical protein
VVGEIKTPWAVDHDIATAVLDAQHGTDEDELRNMLGNFVGSVVFYLVLIFILCLYNYRSDCKVHGSYGFEIWRPDYLPSDIVSPTGCGSRGMDTAIISCEDLFGYH